MAQQQGANIQLLAENISGDSSIPAEAKAKVLATLHAITPPPTSIRFLDIPLGCHLSRYGRFGHRFRRNINRGTWRKTLLPDGVVAIGSAAVGALAGLLAPSPTTTTKWGVYSCRLTSQNFLMRDLPIELREAHAI
jgi:hypothetical protein